MMWDLVSYLLWITLAAAALFAAVYCGKAYLSGTTPLAMLLEPKPLPRLDVIENTNVDGKRRLLLVRRDDVEHLIMTGGPVDVVIETGIMPETYDQGPVVAEMPTAAATASTKEPTFARPARTFRRAVGEN
jgi:flagellar protein FliO/FliZ